MSAAKSLLLLFLVGCAWGQQDTIKLASTEPFSGYECFLDSHGRVESAWPKAKLPDCILLTVTRLTHKLVMPLPKPLPPFPLANTATTCTNLAGCSVAEPMDVPAVRGKKVLDLTQGECAILVGGVYSHTAPPCRFVRKWTCQDRSRVLLTDEAGKKHCVKF